ncbi:N-acetylneuraminate synthase family protein [Patescibacteria group bacterium]
MKTIKIKNKIIGIGHPVFIVAELGINHNGDIRTAKKMIEVAKKCGADAIKMQTFITEEFISDKNIKYTYKSQGRKVTESQYKMFKRYEIHRKTQKELFDFAKKQNIIIFSTPQDSTFKAINYLCSKAINMPAIKVGSDDLSNLPLLSYYAKKKRPMIISTGMATIDEIEDAVKTIESEGNKEIIILKCTSLYPTPPEKCNLEQIGTLQRAFNKVIGYSDHSEGTTSAVVATILGAKVIEKHFTLSKEMAGPDHWFSANPEELKLLVKQVREAEKMLGRSQFVLSKAELKMKRESRRSIVARKDIKKGNIIKGSDLELKRPGNGLPPKHLPFLIGRTAKKNIKKGSMIILKDL